MRTFVWNTTPPHDNEAHSQPYVHAAGDEEIAGAKTFTTRAELAQGAELLQHNTGSATDYERGYTRWSSNVWTLGTEHGGSGTAARGMRLSAEDHLFLRTAGIDALSIDPGQVVTLAHPLATTETAAKIKTVTGTSNRLAIGGTSTDPIFDISTAYVGQSSVTTLGTIVTGVWHGTVVAALYGGTGLSTYAVGDLVYASATTPTMARLAAVATGSVLVSAGTNTAPAWSSAPTLTSLTLSGDLLQSYVAGTNYERGFARWVGTSWTLGTEHGGAGEACDMRLSADHDVVVYARGALAASFDSSGLTLVNDIYAGSSIRLTGATGMIETIDITLIANSKIGIAGDAQLVFTSGKVTLMAGDFDVDAGVYRIGGTTVLGSAALGTGVVGSSLTSVGTIVTGVWHASTVAALYGGTGLSTYAVGDLVYASATTPTMARLAAVATGSVLVSAGTNTAPAWATNFSAGTITAALSGNATTATTLATARAINGVNFDGSAAITITAAAGTLTGTTLNASVVSSSLTSVGTVTSGTWNATVVAALYGGTGLSTAAVGDLLYASATTPTWARLAAVTTGSVLVSAGTNTAPAYSASPSITGLTLSGNLTLATASITGISSDTRLTFTAANGAVNALLLSTASNTQTSGTASSWKNATTFAPTSTSTMVAISTYINPTINYSAGTPGAGSYEALRIDVVETALPTGTNYLIRARAGSAGTTDKFSVTNAGNVTAGTYNGLTVTSSTGTVTLTNGKVLSVSNTLTFTGTDSSSVAFGAGGTVAYTSVATLSSLTSIGTIGTGVWQGAVVAALYGGTGLSTAAVGDLMYASATTPTWSRLAAVATGSVLYSQGTNTAPIWTASPTLTSPVIADLNPGADFTITNNSIKAFTSANAGAIVNTLYLKTGNVGVGTASPNVVGIGTALTIQGVSNSRGSLELQNASTGTGGTAGSIFGLNGSTRLTQIDMVADGATNSGSLQFLVNNAGAGVTTQMTLDHLGLLNVVGGYKINGTPGADGGPGAVSTITVVKGIVTAFTAVSDERLKHWSPYDPGLGALRQVRSIYWTWNDLARQHYGFDGSPRFGFSAQSARGVRDAVGSEVWKEDGSEWLTLDREAIYCATVNAVQELDKIVDSLQHRLDERLTHHDTMIESMGRRLAKLEERLTT